MDLEGTVVIAEAIKNTGTKQRTGQIVSDLLCSLCDNNCTVGEAFEALSAARDAIRKTRLNVAQYGNDPEVEGGGYGED